MHKPLPGTTTNSVETAMETEIITLSEIVEVLLTGGSYRIGLGSNETVDFAEVNVQIDEMDGENGLCDDMNYGELKRAAAELVAVKYGEQIAFLNGWKLVNDMEQVA